MTEPRLAEGCVYDAETQTISGWTLWERWDRIVSGAVAHWGRVKRSARKEKIRKELGLADG